MLRVMDAIKMNENFSVLMRFERSTPGTYRYRVIVDTYPMRALYIDKGAFRGTKPPPKIKVTIEILDVEQNLEEGPEI